METYDICITAVPTDSDTARTLADSLRRYRLPGGVTAEPGRERRSVTLDLSGSPLDDEVRAQLDESRFLILLCSPEIRSHRGILDRLDYFRVGRACRVLPGKLLREEARAPHHAG